MPVIDLNHSKVSLAKLSHYNNTDCLTAVRELLKPLGGIEAFVKPGQRVLLKPNLLSGKPPDKAVTTHPEIVRAVARLAQKAGGIVSIGDSPGIGNPESVARKSGILAVAEETGCPFVPFETAVTIHPKGRKFQQFEVAQELLDADVVINLPKLKTHQMIGLTCGIKNMFGAVVGLRKPRLHLQAGTDKAFFALMLLELCEALSPALTIVDAVVGMEGEGPGSGNPVQIGVLLAGSSPQAIDTIATELVGMDPQQVWTQQQAIATSRPYTTLGELELCGPSLDDLKVPHFQPAKMTDVNFGLKGSLKHHLRHALTARPLPDHNLCVRCGDCVTHCPPEAMKIANNRLIIDYDCCIRCFCCQELCPHGALMTRQGVLLKLNSLLRGK